MMTTQTMKKRSIAELYQYDGWTPVKYGEYINKNWTFVSCEPESMTHMKHIESGKLYRWNQASRMITHTYKLLFDK